MPKTLTVNEAAALFALDEGRIRKDLEYGVLADAGRPPRFELARVVYLLALTRFGFELGIADRKQLYARISEALASGRRPPATLSLSPVLELKLGELYSVARSRLERFETWKARLVTDPKILGGEPTFPKTRLAVRQIGGMLLRGASPAELREDYPFLTPDDLELAKLYTQAHPRVGRPREAEAAPR